MKNAKKILLVDVENIKHGNEFKNELDVKAKPLLFMKNEIDEILSSTDQIDDKLRKYFYALSRFLFFKENSEKLPVTQEQVYDDDRGKMCQIDDNVGRKTVNKDNFEEAVEESVQEPAELFHTPLQEVKPKKKTERTVPKKGEKERKDKITNSIEVENTHSEEEEQKSSR